MKKELEKILDSPQLKELIIESYDDLIKSSKKLRRNNLILLIFVSLFLTYSIAISIYYWFNEQYFSMLFNALIGGINYMTLTMALRVRKNNDEQIKSLEEARNQHMKS